MSAWKVGRIYSCLLIACCKAIDRVGSLAYVVFQNCLKSLLVLESCVSCGARSAFSSAISAIFLSIIILNLRPLSILLLKIIDTDGLHSVGRTGIQLTYKMLFIFISFLIVMMKRHDERRMNFLFYLVILRNSSF